MQVTSVLGSPRKKGNTNRVLGWVEEALRERGFHPNRINVVDRKILGCKGCWTCKKFTDRPGCPQKDDAVPVMKQLMASDLVIYATPVYFWGPTAQMKTLIDRHCSLVTGFGTPRWASLMEGKQTALVATCEDAVENNAEPLLDLFERLAAYLKCTRAGALVIPFATTPESLGNEVRDRAVEFAGELVK